MSEREELTQAISALEAQRATLGDAVVDASQGALREKLAALDAAVRPEQQRKQVTILFMDVVGSAAIVRELDPEDNLAIMDTALRRLAEPVARHGGRVTRYMGDGFIALFGHPVASEYDPDNAVRAGLAILEEAQGYSREIEAGWDVEEFTVRVGIDTGQVVIGGDSEAANTLAGTAVNLAARLENAAEPGTMLISHNTYQHVRGVFDLQPLHPVQAKGFAEPVPVYQVLRAKARSFRTRRRGVEGIETRFIGRRGELKVLQDAYDVVVTDGERRVVTIVGEAGLGKSRLLYEFENWVDLQPITVTLFRGRARQETERQPYGLFRDLFAFRFGVQDDDPAETVSDKLVTGIQEVLGDFPGAGEGRKQIELRGHFIGHLLGYGFNTSPHIRPVSGDPQQLRDRALIYLIDYFKTASAQTPVFILLEDLHWADDSSLDVLNRLVLAMQEQPTLIVSATRPDLFQRRQHWMEGHSYHQRLDLRPLSRTDSRLLTREVLRKIDDVPDTLRDLIVANAEGNPFFVEELVKMLIGEGAIVKEEPAWRVIHDRLAGVRVPSTLTGVLQARLDALPGSERAVLQRASVVGRVFWEQTVAFLNRKGESTPDDATVASELLALRDKEMVFRRETSAFAGASEHIFKHVLLRDVTYESVLKRARREYHALAAEWLIQRSRERADEFSGLIADHLERAGKDSEAMVFLRRAGEDASNRYAHEEAAGYFGRALTLAEDADLITRCELLLSQERAYGRLGRRDAQRQALQALEDVTNQMGDSGRQAKVAYRWSRFLVNLDDYAGAIEAARVSIRHADAAGDHQVYAGALVTWGLALLRQGRYHVAKERFEAGLTWARRAEDPIEESHALNNLGLVATQLGDFEDARAFLEQSAELARQAGSRGAEAGTLSNLGNVVGSRGDYESARRYYQRACKTAHDIGDRHKEAVALGNLGRVEAMLGRYAEANHSLSQCLAIVREIGGRAYEAYTILNLALVSLSTAEFETTRTHAKQALEIVRAIGDPSGEAFALTYLAHGCLGLNEVTAAEEAYAEAVAILNQSGQPHMAMEPIAGLAQAALIAGDNSRALLRTREILDFLDGGGTFDGTEAPLRVYSICYKVLDTVQEPRAIQMLSTAYALLQEWAAKITDEATRRSVLENVPWHREIAAAARSHGL